MTDYLGARKNKALRLSAAIPPVVALVFTLLVVWLSHSEHQRIERTWERQWTLRAELMSERGGHAHQTLNQVRLYLRQTLAEADNPASELRALTRRWPGLVLGRVDGGAVQSVIPTSGRATFQSLFEDRHQALERPEGGRWVESQGSLYRLGRIEGESGHWLYGLTLEPAMAGYTDMAEHWTFSFEGKLIASSDPRAGALFERWSRLEAERLWRDGEGAPWLSVVTEFEPGGPIWWQVESLANLATDHRISQQTMAAKWAILWVLANLLLGIGWLFWGRRTRRMLGQQRHDFNRERNELDDSRRRLELALQSSQSGHWDWDIDRALVHFSEHWKRMLGASVKARGDLSEWTGRIHPDDADECARRLSAHLKGETDMFEHEQRLRDEAGHYQWFLTRGRVIERGEDGRARRMTGVYTQIDERKRTQEMVTRQQQALEKLNEITALPGTDADELLRRGLQLGADYLQLPLGIVSRIEDSNYTVQVQISPPGTLEDGQQFYLPHCFCVETLKQGDVLGVAHTADSALASHPCYLETQLESYIGAPVWVSGTLYGTLSFSGPEPREAAFSQAEHHFVRMLARWVGATLERWLQGQCNRELSDTFTKLANSLPGCLIQYHQTPDGHSSLPYASRGIEAIFGVTSQEVRHSAEPAFERVHPDDLAMVLATAEHSARTLSLWSARYRVNHPQKGWLWISGQASPELDEGGAITWYGFLWDVTEEVQAEQHLRSANRWREALLNAASVSFIATDKLGVIQTFNRGAEQMLGYRAEEMVGQKTPEVLHRREEVVERSRELSREMGMSIEPGFDTFVAKARAVGIDEAEWTYVRKDGTSFPVILSVTAVRDEAGRIDGYLGVGRDISLLRRQAERIRAIAERTQTILDNAADGIVAVRHDGFIESFNKAAERLFGWSAADVIGRNVSVLMPSEFAHNHDRWMQTHREGRLNKVLGISREVSGMRRDGSVFPVEIALSEISQEDQPLYIAMVRDITERKRVERMKTEFVATVSHELRTPLTAISGSLRLMHSGSLGEVPAPMQNLLRIAHSNSDRLIHLVNDLLDMEKLVAGKMPFASQYEPLVELVSQSLDNNAAYAEPYGVHYRLECKGGDRADQALVFVDPHRLQQVMANLLSNAAKFAPRNSEVLVRVELTDHRARVSVVDRGEGVPEAFRERIFDKFSQADASTTKQKGGTGLGLAISKEIIERLGGEIGFDSKPGEGACFYFDLPYVRALHSSWPQLRVLHVEDDPDQRQLVAALVGQAVSLEQCGDIASARQRLQEADYDVLLLDRLLPDGDGLVLVEPSLGSKPPTVAVISQIGLSEAERARVDRVFAKDDQLPEQLTQWFESLVDE